VQTTWSNDYTCMGDWMASYSIYCARIRAAAASAQNKLPPRLDKIIPSCVRESSKAWFEITSVMVTPVVILPGIHCLLIQLVLPGRAGGILAAARFCARAAILVSCCLEVPGVRFAVTREPFFPCLDSLLCWRRRVVCHALSVALARAFCRARSCFAKIAQPPQRDVQKVPKVTPTSLGPPGTGFGRRGDSRFLRPQAKITVSEFATLCSARQGGRTMAVLVREHRQVTTLSARARRPLVGISKSMGHLLAKHGPGTSPSLKNRVSPALATFPGWSSSLCDRRLIIKVATVFPGCHVSRLCDHRLIFKRLCPASMNMHQCFFYTIEGLFPRGSALAMFFNSLMFALFQGEAGWPNFGMD